MSEDSQPDDQPGHSEGRKFVWPWIVLALALLGFVLAFFWMSHEVRRTRSLRDMQTAPTSSTNQPAAR